MADIRPDSPPIIDGAQFALTKFEPMFHSPLVMLTLPQAAQLNPQVLSEIAAIRAAEPGIKRSNRGGWHSTDNLCQRREPGIATLVGALRDAVVQATRKIAPAAALDHLKLDMEGWINVNPTGAFNAPHDHPGWYWSGAYYVATPPNDPTAAPTAEEMAGCIEFLDPRNNARLPSRIDATCMAPKVALRPVAGQLLLFPSFLRHWVYPSGAREDRVSIAINARFVAPQAA